MSFSAKTNSTAYYQAGFNECTNEVLRYLSSTNAVDVHIKSMILSHLSSCIKPIDQPRSPYYRPNQARYKQQRYHLVPGHVINGKVAAVLLPTGPVTGQQLVPQDTLPVPTAPTQEPLWRPW